MARGFVAVSKLPFFLLRGAACRADYCGLCWSDSLVKGKWKSQVDHLGSCLRDSQFRDVTIFSINHSNCNWKLQQKNKLCQQD